MNAELGTFPPADISGADWYLFRNDGAEPQLLTLAGRPPKDLRRSGASLAEVLKADRRDRDGVAAYLPDGKVQHYPFPQPAEQLATEALSAVGIQLLSGFGKYHTDEEGKPDRRPYSIVDLAGIRAMVDKPQEGIKDGAQWLIPSTLMTRSFKAQEERGEFWLLWADLDENPQPLSVVADALGKAIDASDCEIYTSKSATAEKPKARILIPLARPLPGLIWMIAQEVLNDKLMGAGITPDRTSERPAQLCYLPNRGGHYEARSTREGVLFDPLTAWATDIAAKQEQQRQSAEQLRQATEAASVRRQALTLGDRPDTIDAFNRVFTVQEILLAANYAQRGNTFRHPASESGSYSASVRNGRVHSLSSADPLYTDGAGVGAHDAFSAFTVLFAGGNRDRALKLAGDEWLTIGGESWNKARQRQYMQAKADSAPAVDLSGILAQGAGQAASSTSPPSLNDCLVDLGEVVSPESEHPHVVAMHVPQGEVTLLAGHGSAGKSYIVLLILIHVALGMRFGTLATSRTKVLFYSAEDDKHELLRRVAKICRSLGVSQASLVGWLFLMDVSETDPTLYRVSPKGDTSLMPMLDRLADFVQENDIGLTVIDNASDTFDGNEIARSQVRAFIRTLRARLARPDRAVILLAHVSKAAAHNKKTALATDEDYSGSTAWHNSVRSRLSLDTDDNGTSTLKHLKANKGPKAEPIKLEWHEGTPMLAGTYQNPGAEIAAAFVRNAQQERDSTDKSALVAIIWDFDRRGDRVPVATTGPHTAYRVFKAEAAFPAGLTSERMARLLRELEREGRIFRTKRYTASRKYVDCYTCSPAVVESAPMSPPSGGVSADCSMGCRP